MNVETLVQEVLAEQAEAIDARRPAWESVVGRARPARPRPAWARPALALALALAVVGVAVAATRGGSSNLSTVSEPPAPAPAPAPTVHAFSAVDHHPTGPVVTLLDQPDWRLIAFPSTVGPCVGVQAKDPARQPVVKAADFPAASVECGRDLAERRLTAFRVSGPFDFLVGLTTDVVHPLTATVNNGRPQTLPLRPLPFQPTVAAYALHINEMASIDVRQAGAAEYARYDMATGPGVVVASSDDLDLIVHADGTRVCLDVEQAERSTAATATTALKHAVVTSAAAQPSGHCTRFDVLDATVGRGGPRVITGDPHQTTRTFGTAPLEAKAVRLLDPAGNEVARVPTFTARGSYGVSFFIYEGPPLDLARAEPV